MKALDGGQADPQVIAMTPSMPEAELPDEAPADSEAPMPAMTEEVSIVPAPEVAPAATGDAGELPGFLTGQQARKTGPSGDFQAQTLIY